MIVNNLSRDYNLRTKFAFILLILNKVVVHYRDFLNNLPPRRLLSYNKHNRLWLLARDVALKLEMPIMFSLSHLIDIEEDPQLQYQWLHRRRRRASRLDDSLLNDIYLRVNLLILWWMLLTHWVPWILRIALFVSLFWQLVALIAMLFTGKRSVLKSPS